MRTLWFVAGTAAGFYVTSQARRAVEAVTVDGFHDRLTGWFAGAAVLRSELAAGMHDREQELREQLQLAPVRSDAAAITAGPLGPAPQATVSRLPAARTIVPTVDD